MKTAETATYEYTFEIMTAGGMAVFTIYEDTQLAAWGELLKQIKKAQRNSYTYTSISTMRLVRVCSL